MRKINVIEDIKEIRRRKPLIHHIMNFVVMTDAANATLAIGASPIMAHAIEELEDLVLVADGIYINIGTLDNIWINSMIKLALLAEKYNKPLLLDPVGAGATKLRTEVSKKILETGAVKILKGNAGEMLSLAGLGEKVKGVDSLAETGYEAVSILAEKYNVVAVATGKIDYVSDGDEIAAVEGGSELFKYTTGTGCMLGSVMASFMAVNKDHMNAAIEGSAVFKKAGEIAEKRSGDNPGTFRIELINALYNIDKYNLTDLRIRFLK
ncbi:MAG: hydroxyethylthiazole kinase [Desulfurococcales archaeon]|nr:hydroxyethylthiazole kinase [Desulfurococcales archaeon]